MGSNGRLGARLEAMLAEVEIQEPGFGAGVAVARNGTLIGAAWIGEAASGRPWSRTTPVVTWSVSKGVVAMLVGRLAQDGLIDPDAPIRSYWPGFGGTSEVETTLADVMTHRAGLAWMREGDGRPSFADPGSWAASETIDGALADMPPSRDLQGRVAYHALTFGWLAEGCVRRATGAGLDTHLQRLVTPHEDITMSFGTRSADVLSRLARPGVPEAGAAKAAALDQAFADDGNLLRRSLAVPGGMTFAEVLRMTQDPEFLAAATPAISLISDAGSLAKAYSLFAAADQAETVGWIGAAGRDKALELRAQTDDDGITGGARTMALGFVLNSPPSISLAPGARAFGHPGMGGSLAWGDPDTGLGFAYLTNGSIPDTVTDERASALSRIAPAPRVLGGRPRTKKAGQGY